MSNDRYTENGRINVYVGSDSKLHFVNRDGADTVLNFSSGVDSITIPSIEHREGWGAQTSINLTGVTKVTWGEISIDSQHSWVHIGTHLNIKYSNGTIILTDADRASKLQVGANQGKTTCIYNIKLYFK